MAKAAQAKSKTTSTRKKTTKKPSTVAKRVTTKKKQAAPKRNFFEAKVTDQSLYWLIFGAVAIVFSLWIYTLDARIRSLYDQIDINTQNIDTSLELQEKKEKKQQEDRQ